MKSQVMSLAWKIAKNASTKFGGKAIEYIAGTMLGLLSKKTELALLNSKQLKIKCAKLANTQWSKF